MPLSPRVMVTAAEAFPVFEEQVLAARTSILMAFRIFEVRTPLVSDAARAIGTTWADLIINALDRGVTIDITLSDFDPVTRPAMHRRSWYSLGEIREAGARSTRPDLLSARIHMHPARVGILPRLLLWPLLWREVRRTARELNARPPEDRARALAHMPAFRPMVSETGGTVRARLFPPPQLCPVTHHQKVAVFDEEVLYIGGLDLNERRWDTSDHDRPAPETWHDVQVLLKGPVARSAATHVRQFREVAEGAAGAPTPGVLRTLSRRRDWVAPYQSPALHLHELSDAHHANIRRARGLIYLESQYFRDRRLARALARRAREMPGLGLVLLLPAAPEEVAFENHTGLDSRYGEFLQAQSLRILRRAFLRRAFIGTIAQTRERHSTARDTHFDAPIIYLHSKVSVFDGTAAIVSSANLNGRSLRWDTEAGVMFTHAGDVATVLRKAAASWVPQDDLDRYLDPATAVPAWHALARSNASRLPAEREGFLLPYNRRPAERHARNLPGVPEDMV